MVQRVPKIQFSGIWNQPKNGFKASWTEPFFHFCHIFVDFSKFCSTFSTLHFEKSSNMAKIWQNMKKTHIQLAFNLFPHGAGRYPKPRFRVPTSSATNRSPYIYFHQFIIAAKNTITCTKSASLTKENTVDFSDPKMRSFQIGFFNLISFFNTELVIWYYY